MWNSTNGQEGAAAAVVDNGSRPQIAYHDTGSSRGDVGDDADFVSTDYEDPLAFIPYPKPSTTPAKARASTTSAWSAPEDSDSTNAKPRLNTTGAVAALGTGNWSAHRAKFSGSNNHDDNSDSMLKSGSRDSFFATKVTNNHYNPSKGSVGANAPMMQSVSSTGLQMKEYKQQWHTKSIQQNRHKNGLGGTMDWARVGVGGNGTHTSIVPHSAAFIQESEGVDGRFRTTNDGFFGSSGGPKGRGVPDVAKAVEASEKQKRRMEAKKRTLNFHQTRIQDRIMFEAEVEKMNDAGRLQAKQAVNLEYQRTINRKQAHHESKMSNVTYMSKKKTVKDKENRMWRGTNSTIPLGINSLEARWEKRNAFSTVLDPRRMNAASRKRQSALASSWSAM